MYLNVFGGSGLLHLLAAHPRVVAVFGIAATVSMLASPLGPGRFGGTAEHLNRIEKGIATSEFASAALQARAEREATLLLERREPGEIEAAVASVLRRCGSGCTDLSTATIINDRPLLHRVLVLHELDTAATEERDSQRLSASR